MASAHDAGLMVLPFLFKGMDEQTPLHTGMHEHAAHSTGEVMAHGRHANILSNLPTEPSIGLLVILVHTLGYLLIMGLAMIV